MALGLRSDTAIAIREFANSFLDLEEKMDWTTTYLKSKEDSQDSRPIRHELYEQVIFPALLDGYRRSDAWSMWWLARTIQNLYRAQHLWMQVDRKSDLALLKELN